MSALSSARLQVLLLVGCALALFAPGLFHPFVVYDDSHFILQNPAVLSPGQVALADHLLTPHHGYIIPVTQGTHTLLHTLGQGQAWIFHLAGLLLHLLMVWQIWVMARREGATVTASSLAAAVFAIHPLVVEPVCWATGIKELLMGNLALASTALFVHSTNTKARMHQFGAVALGGLAMLAKPSLVLLGLAWVVWVGVTWRQDSRDKARAALPSALLMMVVGGVLGLMSRFAHDTLLLGAENFAVSGPLPMLMSLGYQAHHLVWPDALHPIYPMDRSLGFADPHTALGLGVVALALVCLWGARRHAAAMLTLALAVAAWIPVSNLLPFPRFMADSYMYVPLASLCLAAAWGGTALAHRRPGAGKALVALTLAALVALAPVTMAQVQRWEGGDAMWAPLNEDFPTSTAGQYLLGASRLARKDTGGAVEAYHRGFTMAYYPPALPRYAMALVANEQRDEAECVLIESVYASPNRLSSLHNLLLFVGQNTDRTWQHPSHVAALLDEARAHQGRKVMRWSPSLDQQLVTVRATLAGRGHRAPVKPVSWQPKSCAAFR